MKFLLVAINAKYIHSNPAVYSLKKYALSNMSQEEQNTNSIIIKEFTINNQLDDILEEIYAEQPDFIGFSCYIWNISYINALIPELCKLLPDTHIWVGGPEVSYRAKAYIEECNYKIRGVIEGEGEETFYELIKAYLSNTNNEFYTKSLPSIKGITYINATDSDTVIRTTARPALDIDRIPFTYSDMTDFENRIVYYESSRGCPFSCSYCLSSIEKKIRFRSLELVEQELQFFLDNKVPQVKFIDRTFNCNPNRALHIWNYVNLHDNGITNFHFEIAGDLMTEEQIKLINSFRPGLIQLEIGVQSTNTETLKEIRRHCDMEKLVSNVSKIKSGNNVHQHLDLIAGLPYENLEIFKKSFNTVYSMEPDQLQLGFLKVLSGSYMEEMTNEYGIVYKDYPPYEVLKTNWLPHDDIILLKKVENVLEIYYNSHQFHHSIKELIKCFDTPFEFYEALGNYYHDSFDTKAKHSRISRYNLLLEFYRKLSNATISEDAFCQLLTLDLYLRENMKTRPHFSRDLKSFHKNLTILKQENNLSNKEHIEVFIEGNQEIYVHFDYENRDPLTHDAKLTKLTL